MSSRLAQMILPRRGTKSLTGPDTSREMKRILLGGSSTSVYMKNRLILNGGANMTVNPLTMPTNINAGTTMNLNLATSVTYQIADTLTTGPGRVYSANQSYPTVGLDSIKFVAGLEGAERTKCQQGWKGFTFAAATLLGMAVSIVPVVYNHFSPQNRLKPLHQAIGTYAASSLMFLSYWRLGPGVFDEYDMDSPNRLGKTLVTFDREGFFVHGPRMDNGYCDIPGAE